MSYQSNQRQPNSAPPTPSRHIQMPAQGTLGVPTPAAAAGPSSCPTSPANYWNHRFAGSQSGFASATSGFGASSTHAGIVPSVPFSPHHFENQIPEHLKSLPATPAEKVHQDNLIKRDLFQTYSKRSVAVENARTVESSNHLEAMKLYMPGSTHAGIAPSVPFSPHHFENPIPEYLKSPPTTPAEKVHQDNLIKRDLFLAYSKRSVAVENARTAESSNHLEAMKLCMPDSTFFAPTDSALSGAASLGNSTVAGANHGAPNVVPSTMDSTGSSAASSMMGNSSYGSSSNGTTGGTVDAI